jgi:hypothetical protein
MFILLELLPLLMIKNSLFVVNYGCSSWENIDIEKKCQGSRKYRISTVSEFPKFLTHIEVLPRKFLRFEAQHLVLCMT